VSAHPDPTPRRRRVDLVVLAVLALTAVAAALRFWGIQHGLPHPGTRPDEREVLDQTIGFASGDWNPRWFIYPPLYFHLTWLWDEAVLAVWRLWRPRESYFELLRTNLAPLLLGGRMMTAALGAVTVPVAFAVARRVGGRTMGLVTAALVAGEYLLVRDSHALKPDIHLALGALVAVWCLARYVEQPTLRHALVAGVVIGLTTAVKYNGILLLVPAYLAECMAPHPRRRWRLLPTRTGWILGLVAVGSFLLVSPHMLLDFAGMSKTFAIATWNVYVTRPGSAPPPDAGWLERAWTFVHTRSFGYHLALSLRYGCGLAVTLLAAPALLLGLRRRVHPLLPLAVTFAVLHYLVAGASPVRLARYFTPSVPLLLLLIANLVVLASRVVPARWRSLAIGLATLAILAEPLRASVAFDRVASETDTRVLATEWLARVPGGGAVAFVGAGPFTNSEPTLPIGFRKAALRVEPGGLEQAGVTHVITIWHHALTFFAKGTLDDLAPLRARLRQVAEFSPYAGAPAGVFEAEDTFFIPFHEFAGVARPGPLLRVYAVTP
jgi:4-amino-4-deoxy-L-arabinose transferase-like glycosyltransferase